MDKKIIHSVFENVAEKFSGNIAIEQGERNITYDALNRNANRIAHALHENGVEKNAVVGIFLPGSIEYIAGIMGVSKSGGVFMPLDIEFPEKRLEYILKQTLPKVVVTSPELKDTVMRQLSDFGLSDKITCLLIINQEKQITVIQTDNGGATVSASEYSHENPQLRSGPDDSNYIIFTSGSTGDPKAILGCHKGLSHFVHWEIQEFALDENIHVSLFAPTTFDVSFRDIFVPLLTGGTVCIPEQETRANIRHLLKWMEDSKLTLVHCVPSLFRLILKEIETGNQKSGDILPDLKHILLAGEAVYGSDVIRWMDCVGDRIELVNIYGPSETTLAKIYHRINEKPLEKNKIIPLGQPISNTAVLILKDNALCRVGEIGEIFIKTPFRSKGYYNAPELNAASFVQNPLNTEEEDIIYKTGDLGRYLPDRSVEFIGRLDGQVKVNGIRIEMNEIESKLFGYDTIERPLIIAHKTPDYDIRLVCYYTEKSPTDIDALRAYLRHYLPVYMIPSFFVRLDEFPFNINGKIDKKALPKPEDIIYATIKYESPANEIEESLAEMWGDVLGLKKVGVNNPFFQIGGNSLSAIRIISKIYKTFEREISIQDFFAHSTVRNLSAFVSQSDKLGYAEIEPVELQEYYDASHAQRRLWIIDQLEQNLVNYNIPGACLLDGAFDVPAFHKAFQRLVERHESLRTSFIVVDGEPCQKIHDDVPFVIEEMDLSGEADNETLARKYAEKESLTPFDLSGTPLLRAKLLKLSEDRHILIVNIHHIISDALSLDVLTKEVLALYTAYSKGEEDPLPRLQIQYKDYAAWQNELLTSDKIQAHKTYWLEKLSGEMPVLNLPTDYPRPTVQTFNGEAIRFNLGNKPELQKIAEENDSSLFMVVISLIKILFHRYTAQQDIIIGTPITGRNHPDLEDQIGFYVNMLALRDQIHGNDTFISALKKVRQTCIEAYNHQLYPFDKLTDELGLERDMSRSPVFDVIVVMHNETQTTHKAFDNVEVSEFDFQTRTSKYDLTFTVTETRDAFDVVIEYNTDLFEDGRILRMRNHLEELAKSVVNAPDQSVAYLNILPESERHQILVEFNDTTTDYPRDKTIAEVFEAKVREVPDNRAVVYEGTELSYQELNACANHLAHTLKDEFNVGHEECVGVLMDKSERMIISLLGILKSGGAYMAIDPAHPIERIKYILTDSKCRVVIAEGEYLSEIIPQCAGIQAIDAKDLGIQHSKSQKPDLKAVGNGRSLGYVIYTSGSTGNPKGSLIEHRTGLRTVLNTNYIRFDESDKVLQTCSLSFDVSVFDIWGPLLNGGCLCLIPDRAIMEADKMKYYVRHYGIATMWLTTSLFNELLDADTGIFEGMKTLVVGGEKLSTPHINKVRKAHPNLRVVNGYGPTENGTLTTCHQIEKFYERDIPIGRPISNTQVIILDANDQIVPIGIPGELCASGDGLARGYLNLPEQTAEKFVSHPHKPGEKMYRIGDMARWMPDGCVEYFGRNDDQVKIRGYRIELGEIENRFLRHPDIRQAVVRDRVSPTSPARELIAYFVCREEVKSPPDVAALRDFLGQSLPVYMIPSYFVCMEVFPLNVSGKVDRKALPSPEEATLETSTEMAAPRNEIEELMLRAWQRIVGREHIGIYDNYFAIGGDSIKAIQIASRLQEEDLKIEVRDIFQYPTIAGLADRVVSTERVIAQDLITGVVPLTAVQSWFFDSYKRARHHFNQSEMLCSTERFQEDALRTAIEKVQEHHDALRMRFEIRDSGEIIQENCGLDYPVAFETINLMEAEDAKSRLESYAGDVQASMNLAEGPLMKIVLFRLKEEDRLLIVIHHLGIDGFSWRVLAEDIQQAYAQCLTGEPVRLSSKTHSFQYWAEQIQEYADSDGLLQEKAYWKEIEAIPVKSLPTDFEAESNAWRVRDTRTILVSLSEEETEMLLTKVNHAYNTEINDILLTAFARAMQLWHGDSKTLINMEGHGRELEHVDVSRTVGWFTSIYPVVLEIPPGSDDDLGYQIKYVKELLRKIPGKGMGYGILKYLTSSENKKDMAFDTRPQVSFNYLGQFDRETGDQFRLAEESSGHDVSPEAELLYDVDLNGIVIQGKLEMSVTYNRKLYKAESIEKLGAHFRRELLAITAHCAAVEDTEITPSDIDYDGLDIDQLDDVLGSLQ